jgi:hypothetical protein
MTLLGSAQHQSLVDLAKSGSLILCLLEPRLKLLLSHLQVLDVSGGTVQQRNLAGLLVGDGKSILEATVTIPELIASPLLRLDALAADFLTIPNHRPVPPATLRPQVTRHVQFVQPSRDYSPPHRDQVQVGSDY